MSGYLTNGLPAAATSNSTLPFTLNETVALDTNLTAGGIPESEAATLQQLTLIARGVVQALTYTATTNVNCALGSYFSMTFGAGNVIFTFSNPTPGQVFDLELTQDGVGSRTATWPATVTWASGSAPTLTTTAGHTDKLTFIWNATAGKWRGSSSLNLS